MRTELWGKYEVNLAQKGYGGTSAVYFGIDSLNQKKVAIKKMANIALGLKEAWIMNIYGKNEWLVEFFDFFIHDNHACIVMEQLSGSVLDSLSEKEAVKVTINLLKGLQFLHSKGILHADISPRNIILTNKNTLSLKIIDFESAKLKDLEGVYKGEVKNWIFAPPSSKEIDDSYDFYSAAAVCTYVLTGEVKTQNITHAKLKVILEKAMNKDPKQRYRKAADFIQDLETYDV
ncbi:serine/threonine protein kinase [Bacillus massilinigeriensis]|uniref:serine/threonine protein kinase n=1 Tax=Bacillus mediterraneensis TaxID=1805474 RepID=UPI0008F91D40|nr:protein kinase [Bacillus mediterraneensis]